jgi:hypothetical protein
MRQLGVLLWVIIVALVVPYLCSEAAAEVGEIHFELGVGAGSDLHSLQTAQALVAPAVSIPISKEIFSLRLEGTLEFISTRGDSLFVAGVSPLLRATLPLEKIRPFIEIGPGLNYANHANFASRSLGGPFFFSATGAVGIEFAPVGRALSISYRARHLSNGGLREGNESMNSHYIMLSLGF